MEGLPASAVLISLHAVDDGSAHLAFLNPHFPRPGEPAHLALADSPPQTPPQTPACAPAVLVGNSIGSLAALMVAEAAPQGAVSGLALLNCAGGMNNKAIRWGAMAGCAGAGGARQGGARRGVCAPEARQESSGWVS